METKYCSFSFSSIKTQCIFCNILDNNIKVLGVIRNNFEKTIDLYNLHGVYVTGDHLVYYKNKVIRVRDHPEVLYGKKTKNIVSLVTDKGIMKINDIIFRDYLDSHDIIKNSAVNSYIEFSLNKKSIQRITIRSSNNFSANDIKSRSSNQSRN